MAKKKVKKKRMTFAEFMLLSSRGLVVRPTRAEIDALPRPDVLCGVETPESLDHLTMGQLADITADGGDLLKAVNIVTGVDAGALAAEPFERVVGFLNFLKSELVRISDLFRQLDVAHTAEEVQAGIDRLDFGLFGTVDWYARRMGYKNQDEVLETVPWLRVWQCAKNDAEKIEFEKRYNEIISRR